MNINQTPEFKELQGFFLAGLRRHHATSDMHATIAGQWAEFLTGDAVPGRVGDQYFGAICSASPAGIEFLTGVEVETFAGLPPGFGRMRVPPQRYAVFRHEGGTATIWDTWQWVWTSWMPSSGYRDAPTPTFELYACSSDLSDGAAVIEIWFPVEKE